CHPLDGEHDLDLLAGVCEVNNDPVLIAHGGDVTAASQESASADGHVMAAEVLDVGQVVDVADRIGAADACPLPNGEPVDAAGIFFPPKGHNAPAPTVTGAHGDGYCVHLEGGVGWLRLHCEGACHQTETRDDSHMYDGTMHGSTLLVIRTVSSP